MTLIHSNNFTTTLSSSMTNSVTTMSLTSVTGAPTIGSGIVCNFTITDGTNYEIVQATSLSSSTYTITRAAESTTARAWSSGATVAIYATAAGFDTKLDKPTSLATYQLIAGPTSAGGVTQQFSLGTSGQPLVSAGASALPAFGQLAIGGGTNVSGQLAVANGGTGLATTTAYGVLCGGTTSTGNLQSVSGVGTTGQVLTSNGSGALPTWQTGSGGGGITAVNGTTNQITVTTVSGTATVAMSASYAGQNTITTLGTIATGTWQGTTVNGLYGGTGLTSVTANGVLYGATSGNVFNQTTSVNNAILGSNSSGVPSFVTTLPTTVQTNITNVGIITSGTWSATTVAVAKGGTGVTTVTTAPTISSFAGWDANKNLSANNILEAGTTTATAAATTTLTVASTYLQIFTGTTTQTCVMPVASTLAIYTPFQITNNSTGVVTVQSSGANNIVAMSPGTTLILQNNATAGTGASVWNIVAYNCPSKVISAYQSSGQSMSSGTLTNIGTLALPAGNWLVSGTFLAIPSSAVSLFAAGCNNASATLPGVGNYGEFSLTSATLSFVTLASPPVTYISTGSTTIYAVAEAVFSTGTCNGYSYIVAQQVG